MSRTNRLHLEALTSNHELRVDCSIRVSDCSISNFFACTVLVVCIKIIITNNFVIIIIIHFGVFPNDYFLSPKLCIIDTCLVKFLDILMQAGVTLQPAIDTNMV